MAAPHHHIPLPTPLPTLHSSSSSVLPASSLSSSSSSSSSSATLPSFISSSASSSSSSIAQKTISTSKATTRTSAHTSTESTSSTSSFSLLDSASSFVFLTMADTDLDLSLSMPQQQQLQHQQENEHSHHNHHQSQAPPDDDDEQTLSFTSVSQESLVNVTFPFPEDQTDKVLAVPVDDPTVDVTTQEFLYDQNQDDNDDQEDVTTGGERGQDYHFVQRYQDDRDERNAHEVQEETFEYEVPPAIRTPPLSQSADPEQLIHQEVPLQEEDTDKEHANSNTQGGEQHPSSNALPLSIVTLSSSSSLSSPPSPSHHQQQQLLPPLHIHDTSSSSPSPSSSTTTPTSPSPRSPSSPSSSSSPRQRMHQQIPHKITIPSQHQQQQQRSLPASAATPPPLHPNHHFNSNRNVRHSPMGAGPSSSSSSFDASSIPPSPSDSNSNNNHNHRIRHVSSSNRLSRAPKRESSLPFPLPAVLPALPPLIPVSRITSPNSPSGSMPTSATPATPVLASASGRMKGHSLSSIAVHDSRTTLTTESEIVSSGWPADPNSAETGKVPTGEPNTEPSPTSGPTPTSGQEPTTPSTVITPPEDYSAKNTQDNGNSKNSNTEAEVNAGETDDSSTWPEHPRQFLERVKETVSKAELGTLLSKGSDSFHQAVLRIHMESFNFRRDPIDLALRKFLLDFHFPKEAQQIDRVLEAFAGQYHTCNPHLFRSSDVVYTIAFSLMLLHTDAHNKNVRYKMSKDQYVRQAKSIDGVNTIPADILEVLYDNITYLKFVYAEDEMDVDGQRIAEVQPTSGSWFPRRRTASNQRADSYNMIRHGSIAHLAPDLTDLIPFRWPYYWKGTIEMVDNVQINNQFTRAPLTYVPGLRTRGHGHYISHEPSNLGPGAHSIRPETMIHLNGDQDPTSEAARRYNDNVVVSQDGSAELKIVKFGVLSRKIDVENGKKSAVRGWRDLGIILSGSQLLFFTDTTWFQQQRASNVGFNPQDPPEEDGYFASEMRGGSPSMPQALISTLDSIAVIDSSYQKYPHVFRLVCPNGKQYLFRADSEHEMNDWMAKINYASAFKTAGVRLRNYRVAWADDVFWIKDEQGRHQLRRRQKAGSPTRSEPLDGRSQLLQAKMKDIDRQINACSASLAAELRLARGLEVMIPLQSTTRQKIVQSATVVGKRLRQLMLERTKLDCFRTVLERDLAVISAERPAFGSGKHSHHGLGLNVYGNESLSGTTDYSHTSVDSGTLRSGADGLGQDPDDLDYTKTLRQHPSMPSDQQHPSSHRSSPSMNDHMDHIKDEYVLDSTRTSQSSNRSMKGPIRPRLHAPDFQRTVSENAIDDGRRSQPTNNAEIPMGPMAIQAAIIDAARGTQGTIPSTMSSPDPNHYQNPGLTPAQASSQQCSQSPNSSTTGPALLSPETSTGRSTTRSRALSMPGQRPNMMPRTVSIYSSSSQTASRLKQIFEQGLGHFKWGSSSQSNPGSSLKNNTLFPPGANDSDPAFVPESSSRS